MLSARPSPRPARAPVVLGCLGLSPVWVVRGLSPTPPVLASEEDSEGGGWSGAHLQRHWYQLFPLKLRAKFTGSLQGGKRSPLLLSCCSLLHLLYGLCVTVNVAVSQFKYVKESFSASLVSVYLSLLKVTVLGNTV